MTRLIEIARSAVGLTQDDAVFQALCGPGEPSERARDLAKLSTCALFLRGCLARAIVETAAEKAVHLGVNPQPGHAVVPLRLWAPYKLGMAMADLIAVCEKCFAWNDRLQRHITPGRLVIIGSDGQEHVYLVETIHRDGWPDGSIELDAIEAGQVDKQGRQCVMRKRHVISANGADESVNRNGAVTAKPVTWILDPSRLLA